MLIDYSDFVGMLVLTLQLNACHVLHPVERHFFWSSVIYGYLLYDTVYLLVFYKAVGGATFIFHHALALVCCCVGIYLNSMAYFGAVIQVFFEATTPLLHALGCMKILGLDRTAAYVFTGEPGPLSWSHELEEALQSFRVGADPEKLCSCVPASEL
jgi:hypothetical protein